MITLTVAVEGKPYRKSPAALVELSIWSMHRYYSAWIHKDYSAATRFFNAAKRAKSEARSILVCQNIRASYSATSSETL